MTIRRDRSTEEERDTINEALINGDRDLLIGILNRASMIISYEKQLDLLDCINIYQPYLAMRVFEGYTPIQLGNVSQAKSAFKFNNEEMVDILMKQDKLKKKPARMEVFQDAITQGSPLIRKFAEEIINLYLDTRDQTLKTPLIPEMDDVEICFIFWKFVI